VRVKRRGKHEFTSIEVERYVGGGLNQHIETARVKLTDPDVTVNLEIENDRLLLVKGRYEGIGGFPIGTQEDVLSLISGGFDSGVSSYMLMRRGCACITASLTLAARPMKSACVRLRTICGTASAARTACASWRSTSSRWWARSSRKSTTARWAWCSSA
jgi:adenylyl- and sulfurtransferase ThiI